MKKNLFIVVLCLLMAFVTVSCEKEPVHEHAYTAEWKSDATNHWHECSCGEKSDIAAHTWGLGRTTQIAAGSVDGIKEYTCTVCKQKKTEAIPYEYIKTVNVATVDQLISALNSLEDGTCIVMAAGTYDFEGKSTSVNYSGQTGWMMPILKNNVMIKAADGATVKIQSTDSIENGTWAQQVLMLVVGENFVLDGITMGWRGSKNKVVEICAKNTLIKNCTFEEKNGGDGSCLYLQSLYDGTTLKSKTSGTIVSNCTFEKNSSISVSNGAEGLTMKNNTFKEGSIIYLTGKRDTGWNDYSIDVSTVIWEGNNFATGTKMILKATDEDWSTSFGDFDPTTFGLTLESNVEPVAGRYGTANLPSNCTYNARIKTYVKK